MTYEQIDFVCDSYIPVLGILMLVLFLRANLRQSWLQGFSQFGIILGSIATAYGCMAVDKALGLWQYFALDFSTHTIIALLLTAWLWVLIAKPLGKILVVVATLIYGFLMLYQQYHSLADILTTAVIGAFIAAVFIGRLLPWATQATR